MNVVEQSEDSKFIVLHVLRTSLPTLAGYTIRSRYIIDLQKELGLEPFVITSPYQKASLVNGERSEEIINEVTYFRTYRPVYLNGAGSFPLRYYLHKYALKKYFELSIKRICKKIMPTVLHAHSDFFCGLPASRAARVMGIPFVYEVRGFWEDAATALGKFSDRSLRYYYIRANENVVMRRADRIVTLSQGLKEEIIRRGFPEHKVFVVPNGVDTSRFIPISKDQELSERLGLHGQRVMGFIGSVVEWEGLDLVIKSLKAICKEIPNLRFLIVGDGSAIAKLTDLVEQNGMSKTVSFLGTVRNEEVAKYYSVCDLLLYPRNKNKQNQQVAPLKPLEALSMQKAVLASDVGGLKELIMDAKTGLLYKAGDRDDLVRKCILLLKNDKLCKELGEQGRNWVMAQRDWSKVVRLYQEVYDGLGGSDCCGLRRQ